jgi:hypothetical protein
LPLLEQHLLAHKQRWLDCMRLDLMDQLDQQDLEDLVLLA